MMISRPTKARQCARACEGSSRTSAIRSTASSMEEIRYRPWLSGERNSANPDRFFMRIARNSVDFAAMAVAAEMNRATMAEMNRATMAEMNRATMTEMKEEKVTEIKEVMAVVAA